MKLSRKSKFYVWSYCWVIGMCLLGLITIVGTGGGGGDGGGGGGETVSYTAKGSYYFFPTGSQEEIYEEIYFYIDESDMPEDYGFQYDDWYSYEQQFYPDDAGTDEIWLISEGTTVKFYRVGEIVDDEYLLTIGTWEYVDEYEDTYTLTLGESSKYDDGVDLYYYGNYELTVSYSEEGVENPDTLPPPIHTHDPR